MSEKKKRIYHHVKIRNAEWDFYERYLLLDPASGSTPSKLISKILFQWRSKIIALFPELGNFQNNKKNTLKKSDLNELLDELLTRLNEHLKSKDHLSELKAEILE